MGVLCTGVKLLRNWQILGCELHENMFGDRALPGPARGAIVLPQAPSPYNGRGMGRKGFLAVCWPGVQSARDDHVLVCNFAKYLFTDLKKNFTRRVCNKPFLIWLLKTSPHLKYVATLP